MKNQGVYLILNTTNGKGYVGSSNDIKNRIRGHKLRLKNGNHHNIYLQKSYSKYGKDSFIYTILEFIDDITLLTKKELEWILRLKTNNPDYGYNMTLPNEDHPNGIGKHSEQTKELLRRIRYKNKYGKTTEEDYQEWRNNIEIKKSKVHKKVKLDTTVVVIDYLTGLKILEGDSPRDISNKLNIPYKKIIAVLNEENKTKNGKPTLSYKGYKFIYKRNYSENLNYSKPKYKNTNKIILLFDNELNFLKEYSNMNELSEELNINYGTLAGALSKGTLVAKKYYLKHK